MAPQFGRLTTQLSERTIPPDDRFCDEINRLIAPATPLTPDQIYVAAMFLVSDQINSFGGRFPADEHQKLAELLVDSPVLVGHRKDTLPIARNFRAELVDRGDERWVKSYFYWLSGSEGAESLKANIDGGLYKECSIAFTYNLPECSICGDDIRNCAHEPGGKYPTDSGEATCHFNYRQIERVLESSLVYRGAVPNTLVTTDGLATVNSTDHSLTNSSYIEPELVPISSLESLARDQRYLVVPRYDAVPVLLSVENEKVTLSKFDGTPIKAELTHFNTNFINQNKSPRMALLIGLQGRRRCSRREVEQYLTGKAGRVTRLVLTAYPDTSIGNPPAKRRLSSNLLRTLPHRIAHWSELSEFSAQIATRDGVEIWALGSDPLTNTGYLFSPNSKGEENSPSNFCMIRRSATTGLSYLSISNNGKIFQFTSKDFGPSQPTTNRFYLADQIEPATSDLGTGENCPTTLWSDFVAWSQTGESLRFNLNSPEFNALTLRPVKLNRRRRVLVQFHAIDPQVRGCHANR